MLLLIKWLTILVLYNIVTEHRLSAQNISNHNKLSKQLLADYNTNTLPTNNHGKALEVSIQAYLLALGDLDEIDERYEAIASRDRLNVTNYVTLKIMVVCLNSIPHQIN